MARLRTVVETPAYLAAARGVLSDAERAKVVNLALIGTAKELAAEYRRRS